MAGERSVIGEHRMRADDAIVGDMYIGHDPVAITHPGDAAALHRTPIQRAVLADRVSVADLQARFCFASVFFVLSVIAYRAELEDTVVPPDPGRTPDDNMWADPSPRADFHLRPDDRPRPNANTLVNGSPIVNDRARIDQGLLSASVVMISALATGFPATLATALKRKIPRISRSKLTSRNNWSPGTTGRLNRALSTPTR